MPLRRCGRRALTHGSRVTSVESGVDHFRGQHHNGSLGIERGGHPFGALQQDGLPFAHSPETGGDMAPQLVRRGRQFGRLSRIGGQIEEVHSANGQTAQPGRIGSGVQEPGLPRAASCSASWAARSNAREATS